MVEVDVDDSHLLHFEMVESWLVVKPTSISDEESVISASASNGVAKVDGKKRKEGCNMSKRRFGWRCHSRTMRLMCLREMT